MTRSEIEKVIARGLRQAATGKGTHADYLDEKASQVVAALTAAGLVIAPREPLEWIMERLPPTGVRNHQREEIAAALLASESDNGQS